MMRIKWGIRVMGGKKRNALSLVIMDGLSEKVALELRFK